jgi:hypothetical protein
MYEDYRFFDRWNHYDFYDFLESDYLYMMVEDIVNHDGYIFSSVRIKR